MAAGSASSFSARGAATWSPRCWADDIKEYERTRRREVDVLLQVPPPPALKRSQLQFAERQYDTVLQRWRDDQKEEQQRALEAKARVAHLNRARDLQLTREQVFDVVTHEGKLDTIQEPVDSKVGRPPIPTSYAEYNILSNLPFDQHHWSHPDARPRPPQKLPKGRMVAATGVKDFNIVTTRYLRDHEEKTYRDRTLNLLEATQKYRDTNTFDPITQRFTDARVEANARAMEDAMVVREVLHAQELQPLSYRGRASDAYNLITHEAKDPEMLQMLDAAQDARKVRFRTKHAMDEAVREGNAIQEDIKNAQKLAKISHARHEETTERGFNIVSNKNLGAGPTAHPVWQPYTVPKPTAWEKVQAGRREGAEAGATAGSGPVEAAATSSSSASGAAPPRSLGPAGFPSVGAHALGLTSAPQSARGPGDALGRTAAARPAPRSMSARGAKAAPPDPWSAPQAPAVPGAPPVVVAYSQPAR